MKPAVDISSRALRLWVAGLTIGFALFSSDNLFDAWSHDTFSKMGGWSAFVWAIANTSLMLRARLLPTLRRDDQGGRLADVCLVVALVILLLGNFTQLYILRNVALILGVASLLPDRRLLFFSALAGLGWLPASGWLGYQMLGLSIDPLRLPWTLLGCFGAIFLSIRGEKR